MKGIWQLNLRPKNKNFTWKLMHQMLLTRYKKRKIGLNIDGNYPLYHHEEDTIDHLFKNCGLTKFVWLNLDVNCINPNNSDLPFIYCSSIYGKISLGIANYFTIL